MTEELVIFDIDGTLADVSERVHHIKKKPGDWNAFNEGMAQDKATRSMVRCAIFSTHLELELFYVPVVIRKIGPRLLIGWEDRALIIMNYYSGVRKIFALMHSP